MATEWLQLVQSHTMHFDLYYSKTMDWYLRVWKKGCGENGEDLVIIDEQNTDLSFLLATGEYELKNWLLENNGGY